MLSKTFSHRDSKVLPNLLYALHISIQVQMPNRRSRPSLSSLWSSDHTTMKIRYKCQSMATQCPLVFLFCIQTVQVEMKMSTAVAEKRIFSSAPVWYKLFWNGSSPRKLLKNITWKILPRLLYPFSLWRCGNRTAPETLWL